MNPPTPEQVRRNRVGCGILLGVLLLVALVALMIAAVQSGSQPQFRTLAGQVEAMVIPPAMTAGEIEEAARDHCAGRDWCKVLGWKDASAVARGLPMTDREDAALAFELTINRSTGYDKASFRCDLVPERRPRCFTADDAGSQVGNTVDRE